MTYQIDFNITSPLLRVINNTPELGTVSKSPNKENYYEKNEQVTITATPTEGTFSKFIIDGSSSYSQTNEITLTLNKRRQCEVVFKESLVASAEYIDCDGVKSSTLDPEKNYLGVYLTDKNGYSFVVALDLTIAKYYNGNDHAYQNNRKSFDDIYTNLMDGAILQQNIVSNSPAAQYCANYQKQGCSIDVDWRMPTCYELACMASCINDLNTKITNLGGTPIVKTHDIQSGDQRSYFALEVNASNDHPYRMYFDYGNICGESGDYIFASNDNYIRPVAVINSNN